MLVHQEGHRRVTVSFSSVRMVSVGVWPDDGTKPAGTLEPWAAIPSPGFDSKPSSDTTFSISINWFAKVSLVMVGSLTKSDSASASAPRFLACLSTCSPPRQQRLFPRKKKKRSCPSRSPLGSKQPWPEGKSGVFRELSH